MADGGAGPGASDVRDPGPTGAVSERLQVLLSRAVEDQIGEQRQAALVTGELRAEVASVGERVDRLGRRLDEVGDAVARAAGVAAGVGGLADDLAALRSGVTGLAEQVPALREDVGALRPALDAGAGAPRVTPQQLAGAVADLTGRLDRLADLVREANAQSERRILAHVDEAVLAVAEALLRRRRAEPAGPAELPDVAPELPATGDTASVLGTDPAVEGEAQAAATAADAEPPPDHAAGGEDRVASPGAAPVVAPVLPGAAAARLAEAREALIARSGPLVEPTPDLDEVTGVPLGSRPAGPPEADAPAPGGATATDDEDDQRRRAWWRPSNG